EAYDPSSNTWTTKASLTTPRYGPGVAAVNGILYAVGGYNNSGSLATVEAYDPAANTWTMKASMAAARSGFAVVAINGMLYAVGNLATVEAYQP
ncbi:MAG: galactose oxidase, partial [Gemmatimonadetes bacterium]